MWTFYIETVDIYWLLSSILWWYGVICMVDTANSECQFSSPGLIWGPIWIFNVKPVPQPFYYIVINILVTNLMKFFKSFEILWKFWIFLNFMKFLKCLKFLKFCKILKFKKKMKIWSFMKFLKFLLLMVFFDFLWWVMHLLAMWP